VKTTVNTEAAETVRLGVAQILQLGQKGGSLKEDAELYEALNSMRAEDFRDAASLWTTDTKGKLGYKATQTSAILDRWFALDPSSARRFAEEVIKSTANDRPGILANFNRLLTASAARHDPQWALENLLQPFDVYAQTGSNSPLMAEVARGNPALAKEWLARLEESNLRPTVLHGYIAGLSENDPIAALETALREKNSEQPDLVKLVVRAAARQGANSAKIVLERISDPQHRRSACVAALETLTNETKVDPFAFINDMIGVDQLSAVARQMDVGLRLMVAANPEGAANWAQQLPAEVRGSFLDKIIPEWKNRDPDSALAWLSQNQESTQASIVGSAQLMTVNQLLDQGKVDEAVASLSQATQPGRLLAAFASRLANEDPLSASQLISKLPESEANKEAARRFTERWTEIEPSAVADWVQKMPSGGTRDSALGSLIFVVAQHDPEAASRWVNLFSNPKQRQDGVDRVFQYWSSRDPIAAHEWAKSVPGVDEHWKTKFLRQNE
jgi:hypothetical protein